MKKIFGIEAEINITADEDIVKGIGKGISNGSVTVSDIIKETKPEIVKHIKSLFCKEEKTSNKND